VFRACHQHGQHLVNPTTFSGVAPYLQWDRYANDGPTCHQIWWGHEVLAVQPMGTDGSVYNQLAHSPRTVQAEQFRSNLAFYSSSGSIIILIPILPTLASLESAWLSSSYESLGLYDF
jgi:hypothetical protein